MKQVTGLLFFAFLISFGTSAQSDTIKLKSGLKFLSLEKGKGTEKPVSGSKVKVDYTAHYSNGEEYESGSYKFEVDNKEVIPAWDEAVKMMTEGQKAVIVVPPELAYGDKGVKDAYDDEVWYVPPGMTLIFYMTLEKVK